MLSRRILTKRTVPLRALIIPVILCFVSCSSPYLRNRARDFADIVTIEAETRTIGAAVRVGPFKAGLSYKSPRGLSYGLRGGHLGKHNTAEFTALVFGADYFSAAPMNDLLRDGIPVEKKGNGGLIPAGETDETLPDAAVAETTEILAQRKKTYRARSPFGTDVPLIRKNHALKSKKGFVTASYFTGIDVSAGLFGGIRVGVNFGELFDFIVGWFTFDPFDDDEPFPNPEIEKLQKNPMWDMLDDEAKKKILEKGKGF